MAWGTSKPADKGELAAEIRKGNDDLAEHRPESKDLDGVVKGLGDLARDLEDGK